MKKISTRTADNSDLDSLCNLYFEFHEFHALYLPTFLKSLGKPTEQERVELTQAIMQILNHEDSVILVAEEQGIIIGFAEVHLKQPDAADRAKSSTPYAHLQSLGVTKASRRMKVGTQLLQAAEAWARNREALELRLDIWEFSAGPLGFYHKSGYRTFRRSLVKAL